MNGEEFCLTHRVRRMAIDIDLGTDLPGIDFFTFHCSAGHWVTSSRESIEDGPCPALFGKKKEPCSGILSEALIQAWMVRLALDPEEEYRRVTPESPGGEWSP